MSYKMETFEERKVRYIEKIKNLTMMSDILARNVLKDKECCEYILRIIMNDSMLTVLDNQVQVDYKNLHGRSAVLDCVAKSGDGRLFNVEIQQEDEGAIPKRARYHLGLMDMNVLNPGEFFDKLPETYIIFVTQDDTLGYRLPIAHVDRIIKENGAEFGDEAHIIYVDSSKHEDTELGRLMRDFHCKAASDMQDGVLAKRIYELKESEEGVTHMCKVLEEIREEGRMEDKMETANNLYKMGMPLEQIAQAVQVSVQMIQEWLSGETSPVK
ncbi:MAG: PD-(D/E)XK nuclease family transposase [Eubacterium ramulus]